MAMTTLGQIHAFLPSSKLINISEVAAQSHQSIPFLRIVGRLRADPSLLHLRASVLTRIIS